MLQPLAMEMISMMRMMRMEMRMMRIGINIILHPDCHDLNGEQPIGNTRREVVDGGSFVHSCQTSLVVLIVILM